MLLYAQRISWIELLTNSQGKGTKMRIDFKNMKRDSSLAISFITSGIGLLVISVFLNSQVLSLIGLGLTFWGGLFLFITPLKYVEGSYLITSTLPNYMTIDRMLKDLNPRNEAYNIPSVPRNVYLPEHLKGLRETVTFIPARAAEMVFPDNNKVSSEERALFENAKELLISIARDKFLIENPKGLLITSPGIGLLDKIEQKRNIDLTKIPPNELDDTLPFLLGDLDLAKEIKMTTIENIVTLQINDSLYRNLYSQYDLKSVNIIGCPMVSAAACIIAESTGKPTLIQKIEASPEGKTITATFKIIYGLFEEKSKSIWSDGKADLRQKELLEVVVGSIGLIELSFDTLIGLREKRVNWIQLEKYSGGFGPNSNFALQTMPDLNLDFLKISSAINSLDALNTSKEAYSILKKIFEYFSSLNIDDDIKGSVLNFQSAKAIILAYYTLNDTMLGKLVGDIEYKNENIQLETALETLANETDFKVNVEEVRASIEKINPEDNLEATINDVRGIFKDQLNNLNKLFTWFERSNQS